MTTKTKTVKIPANVAKALKMKVVANNVQRVADLIKETGKSMMDLRKPLETIFKKKDIDFVFSPVAHFRIKDGGKTLIIVNKKYADEAEATVGELAIGYEGKI